MTTAHCSAGKIAVADVVVVADDAAFVAYV